MSMPRFGIHYFSRLIWSKYAGILISDVKNCKEQMLCLSNGFFPSFESTLALYYESGFVSIGAFAPRHHTFYPILIPWNLLQSICHDSAKAAGELIIVNNDSKSESNSQSFYMKFGSQTPNYGCKGRPIQMSCY